MTARITVGGYFDRLVVGTMVDGLPAEDVFTGSWPEVLAERNRRCERWAAVADVVVSEAMPETSFTPQRRGRP